MSDSDDDIERRETTAPPAPKKKRASKAEDAWFAEGDTPAEPAAETPAAQTEPVKTEPVSSWDEVPGDPAVAAPVDIPAEPEAATPVEPPANAPAAWPEAAKPVDDAPGGTVWAPSGSMAPQAAPQPEPSPAASTPPPSAPPVVDTPEPTVFIPPTPKAPSGRVEIGSVLNGIYRVTRFIARGGMGEVFEGENVNSDERVAIKVILEHLSKDENVLAMFRKEAKTLTRLSHPALVQYRVMAQEPTLGAFYIVTDFIDGAPLSDVYRTLNPSPEDLISLLKRLAQGLEAAHEIGAVHRDISLDNILLPHGRLDQAKVIDFGIAKDLDQHSGTIVGDGFAGKLGFVAPEQFGAYDRAVGAWTDVYSLALVILTVAGGKPYDMGATLVEAITKRQTTPDVSVAPEILRPLLEHMLAPDPKVRLRSMAEVLTEINNLGKPVAAPAKLADKKPAKAPKAEAPKPATVPPKASTVPPAATTPRPPGTAPTANKNLPLIIGGAAVAVVAIGGGLFFALSGHKPAANPTASTAPAAASGARSPADIRAAVIAAVDKVDCTWVDISEPQGAAGSQSMTISGVTLNPGQLSRIASEAAGSTVEVDTGDVHTLQQSACPVLNSFRKFRTPQTAPQTLIMPVRNYTMLPNPAGCQGTGAQAKGIVDVAKQPDDYVVLGMEPDGRLQEAGPRQAFEQLPVNAPSMATAKPDGTIEFNDCVDQNTFTRSQGLQAVMLLIGKGPFDLTPLNANQSDTMAVPANWTQTFEQNAAAHGWRTEMAWFHITK